MLKGSADRVLPGRSGRLIWGKSFTVNNSLKSIGMHSLSLLVAVLFSMVFLLGSLLSFPERGQRYYRRTISFAAGVGIAYVFLELLPQLNLARDVLLESFEESELLFEEQRVYLAVFIGFVLFYGLYSFASKKEESEKQLPFIFHMAVFFVYVFLFTYVHVNPLAEVHVWSYYSALGITLHLLLIDYSLKQEYGDAYMKKGRCILAAAPITGWFCGIFLPLSTYFLVPCIGFIAGGIILNTMIIELPRQKESYYPTFILGALVFCFLVLFE